VLLLKVKRACPARKGIWKLLMSQFKEKIICSHIRTLCLADTRKRTRMCCLVSNMWNKKSKPVPRSGGGPNGHLKSQRKAFFDTSQRQLENLDAGTSQVQKIKRTNPSPLSSVIHPSRIRFIYIYTWCYHWESLPSSFAEPACVENLIYVALMKRRGQHKS